MPQGQGTAFVAIAVVAGAVEISLAVLELFLSSVPLEPLEKAPLSGAANYCCQGTALLESERLAAVSKAKRYSRA